MSISPKIESQLHTNLLCFQIQSCSLLNSFSWDHSEIELWRRQLNSQPHFWQDQLYLKLSDSYLSIQFLSFGNNFISFFTVHSMVYYVKTMLWYSRSIESLWRGWLLPWKNVILSGRQENCLLHSIGHMGFEKHSHQGDHSMSLACGIPDKRWIKRLQPGPGKRSKQDTFQESQKELHQTLQSKCLLKVTSPRTRPEESSHSVRAEGIGKKYTNSSISVSLAYQI